ncbi:MAG: V-type ATP synthase subunit E [Gammaproteobacteria bacterium]|jgi:V/A-type H+-transporting ATPase subunit E
MSTEPTLDDLEQALMDRARRLADEYLARAESTRERMLSDENEHLRVREEREVLAAELEAERLYRSKVQATEMELRSELDRRRWDMVQQLKDNITRRLDDMTARDDYADILQRFLGAAAEALRDEEGLVAQLCERDHARFASAWTGWVESAAPGRSIELSAEHGDFSGGLLLRNYDDTVRVDHSFEGRMERLEDQINLVLTAELFPTLIAKSGVSTDE